MLSVSVTVSCIWYLSRRAEKLLIRHKINIYVQHCILGIWELLSLSRRSIALVSLSVQDVSFTYCMSKKSWPILYFPLHISNNSIKRLYLLNNISYGDYRDLFPFFDKEELSYLLWTKRGSRSLLEVPTLLSSISKV